MRHKHKRLYKLSEKTSSVYIKFFITNLEKGRIINMNYRVNPKNNDKLSILGFGCMRFSKDEKEVRIQL